MSNITKPNPASMNAPKVIFQMVIKQMDNGTVSLNGCPANLNAALGLISSINNTIVNLFIEKAKANDLDNNNTIKQSQIITLPTV